MKRSKHFFLAIGLASILSACEKNEMVSNKPKQNEEQKTIEKETNKLYMKTDRVTYDKETEKIVFNITNNQETITYGTPYGIEVFENDTWKELQFKEDMAFNMIALLLEKGETATETIDLTYFKQPLKTGKYRIVKKVNTNEGKNITLTAPFELN